MRTSRNSSTSREVLLSCHCGSSFWREEAVAGDEEKQVPRLRSVACGDLAPLGMTNLRVGANPEERRARSQKRKAKSEKRPYLTCAR